MSGRPKRSTTKEAPRRGVPTVRVTPTPTPKKRESFRTDTPKKSSSSASNNSTTASTNPSTSTSTTSKNSNNSNQDHRPLHDANLPHEVGGIDDDDDDDDDDSSSDNEDSIIKKWDGTKFVGCRVAKPFGKTKKWYYGTVESYTYEKRTKIKSWHVQYDDGEKESMTEEEFEHWLNQYNLLLVKELHNSEIPCQTNDDNKVRSKAKTKAATNKRNAKRSYKVTWKLTKEVKEFGYGAFDDCYGSEVQQTEAMYRESELRIPPTQKKEYFTTASKANLVATDQFKWLAYHYIEEEDFDKVKISTTTNNDDGSDDDSCCKTWKWSYNFEDEYENTLHFQGCVEVKKV